MEACGKKLSCAYFGGVISGMMRADSNSVVHYLEVDTSVLVERDAFSVRLSCCSFP